MATMLETPSRIWRRIEAVEDRDMPSLPSLPAFDDSEIASQTSSSDIHDDQSLLDDSMHLSAIQSPIHSTPAASSHYASTIRRSNTSSASRFANSIAHSATGISQLRGTGSASKLPHTESFDVSAIPSLPDIHAHEATGYFSTEEEEEQNSGSNIKETKSEGGGSDEDLSLTEALEPVSRTGTPSHISFGISKSHLDISGRLKDEPEASPFDKFRNISRRPFSRNRTRTPSLTHTSVSSASSSANSTPRSTRSVALPLSTPLSATSVPLPPSNACSPAATGSFVATRYSDGDHEDSILDQTRSMDITDAHISEIKELGTDVSISHEGLSNSDNASHSDDHEPTFSSEEGVSPPGTLAAGITNAFTASNLTTPLVKPRARFDFGDHEEQSATPVRNEGELTPHTRRKSFLLSVINSTTRPRLRYHTPHRPNHLVMDSPGNSTENEVGETPKGTPAFQNTLAGITVRPRIRAGGRLSHPLAQAITASPTSSDSESPVWNANRSPYDGANDKASFISTASSHDLTTHPRANTSFDPAMGFGAGGQGAVGRFNAGKLNNYLHGLNRRLQEENEVLVMKLKQIEEQQASESANSSGESNKRISFGGGNRRLSAGTQLQDVAEDVSAEGWADEKAELAVMVDSLNEKISDLQDENNALTKTIEEQSSERARDQDRWKARMAEVEKGVKQIIDDLEVRAQTAEDRLHLVEERAAKDIRVIEEKVATVENERNLATNRAHQAEEVLSDGNDLAVELRHSNDKIDGLTRDLRTAHSQISELETEVLHSDGRVDELEQQIKEVQEDYKHLEKELVIRTETLQNEQRRLQESQGKQHQTLLDLESAKAYIAELEEGGQTALEHVEGLEQQLQARQNELHENQAAIEEAQQRAEEAELDLQRSSELARQLEEALEATELKMNTDDRTMADLRGKIATLEKDIARLRDSANRTQPSIHSIHPDEQAAAEINALENELDDANREIARLSTILAQSPARKAMEKAKDTKITLLEKENEELLERVKHLRTTMSEVGTPGRIANTSGISPIHKHVLSMSMRAPKTPGGPLREVMNISSISISSANHNQMSWLNGTNVDSSVSPFLNEISRLQLELDRANESIDDKLDKLEDTGVGVVGLTRKLEDARARIVTLEDEIARLTRKEDRRARRLQKLRCRKCLTKVDIRGLESALDADESSFDISSNLSSEPPTPPTRTTTALRANLSNVNNQLSLLQKNWQEEKTQLLGQKATLQEAHDRLDAQARAAQAESKKLEQLRKGDAKTQGDMQDDIKKARQTIEELEQDLKDERGRLRAMAAERDRINRDKDSVATQLRRTESDIEGVRNQLERYKKDNRELETDLRANSIAEQKARLLEIRVSENANTMQQLREERALLATDHKALRKQFLEISEHANHLREEYSTHRSSHEKRQHDLDLQASEIEDLRKALSNQADELHRTEEERNRIATEKTDIAHTVTTLEDDLRRVRRDAEDFGRDLKLLRMEKDSMETKQKEELVKATRSKKQAQAQIRLLNEQLDGQQLKLTSLQDEITNHQCEMDQQQLNILKMQHNKECKGLIVQIRYLKAKFTRESNFRSSLCYQKQYLLILLGQLRRNENTIYAAIASLGFPVAPEVECKRRIRLRSVALGIIFTQRAKRDMQEWMQHRSSRPAITAALHDVRRRRETVDGHR